MPEPTEPSKRDGATRGRAADAEDIARVLGRAQDGRWRRGALVLALVAAAVLGGWFWLAQSQRAGLVSYLTEAVERGTLTVTVTATGSVQPTTQVDVSSEQSGMLAQVEVDYNDRVTVGQVLARLDDARLRAQVTNAQAQLAASVARVAQAEATLDEARTTYESQRELDRRGMIGHNTFVAASASYRRAQAALDIARADQMLAEANLSLQQTDLEKAVIRSPIDGVVLDRSADVGQIVAATLNAPVLFTLAEDLSRMELRVDIDEADISRVLVGQAARFTVDAWPGRSFPAIITQVRYAPEITNGVVTYKAVLSVDNAEGLLRPGMTATAEITVAEVEQALTVPNAALRYTPPQVATPSGGSGGGLLGLIMPHRPSVQANPAIGRSVWVLRDSGPVEVEVSAGETDGKRTAVVADTLAEGDAVVIDQTGGG